MLHVSVARADYDPYQPLADWNSLSLRKTGVTAGMASSYDRFPANGTNDDFDNYDNPSLNPKLVREITGPGVLTRFWMPHLAAAGNTQILLTIDGQPTPILNAASGSLLGGTHGSGPQFRGPFVQTLIGGQVSYEPIPFQNSIRIENVPGSSANFYQWNYHRLPAGTTVASYNGSLNAGQTSARNAAANVLNTPAGTNPAGADATALRTPAVPLVVPAGGSVPLASLVGSGVVREINLNMGASTSDSQLNGLELRVRYDGSPDYAISAPVSHFFGVGNGRSAYKSLPLGVKDDGSYYSYWPMPYRNGVSIELHNTTGVPITTGASSVEFKPGAVPADATYFHAHDFEQTTVAGQAEYEILNITGSGHYVGNMLYKRNSGSFTLEGDETIIVDGDVANAIRGTGLEDAYNGGYYYNRLDPPWRIDETGTPNTAALHGLLLFDNFTNVDQYRWHIPDYIPFTQGIQVNMENIGQGSGNGWGSVAFYYSTVPEPGAAALLLGVAALSLRRRAGVLSAARRGQHSAGVTPHGGPAV